MLMAMCLVCLALASAEETGKWMGLRGNTSRALNHSAFLAKNSSTNESQNHSDSYGVSNSSSRSRSAFDGCASYCRQVYGGVGTPGDWGSLCLNGVCHCTAGGSNAWNVQNRVCVNGQAPCAGMCHSLYGQSNYHLCLQTGQCVCSQLSWQNTWLSCF